MKTATEIILHRTEMTPGTILEMKRRATAVFRRITRHDKAFHSASTRRITTISQDTEAMTVVSVRAAAAEDSTVGLRAQVLPVPLEVSEDNVQLIT